MSKLTHSNLNIEETNLTPIEIALGIDEEGRTTARKLYEFLELAKGQFSRWSKSNILENAFATENEDYEGFDINVEGNATKDYKLSASFAKKLAVGTNNLKGEAAKNYFIKVEEKLKEIAIQSQSPKPMCIEDVLISSLQEMKALKGEVQAVKAVAQEAKEEIQGIRDVITLEPNQWRKDTANLINKIANKIGGFEHIKPVREEAYKILDNTYGVNLKSRLLNKQKKMALEGVPKYKIDKVNYLDVIADDKKLINGYINIVGRLAVKHGIS